jgi:hypothetical protein
LKNLIIENQDLFSLKEQFSLQDNWRRGGRGPHTVPCLLRLELHEGKSKYASSSSKFSSAYFFNGIETLEATEKP